MGESPTVSLARMWWDNSTRDIFSPVEPMADANSAAAIKLLPVQGQHACFSSLMSHFGFSHWSSHFGRGQVVGLAHDQLQAVSSQSGAQFASGAMHVVRHSAGAQTVSHFGQSSFSHISFGQRTEHSGCSQ